MNRVACLPPKPNRPNALPKLFFAASSGGSLLLLAGVLEALSPVCPETRSVRSLDLRELDDYLVRLDDDPRLVGIEVLVQILLHPVALALGAAEVAHDEVERRRSEVALDLGPV